MQCRPPPPPKAHIFCPFHFTINCFGVTMVTSQFYEVHVHRMKLCSMSQVSPYAYYTHCRGPNFHPFHSMMSHIWITAQFWEGKLHQIETPNDPVMFKVKNNPPPHMCSTCIYNPEAQILINFAVQSAVFEYKPILCKVYQLTLKWPWHVQGQKYPCAYDMHPQNLNFHQFHSMMTSFSVTAQVWESALNNPIMTWKVKCSWLNVPISPYAYNRYIPEAQIFICFTLWLVTM